MRVTLPDGSDRDRGTLALDEARARPAAEATRR
jgi:hypothetical protein